MNNRIFALAALTSLALPGCGTMSNTADKLSNSIMGYTSQSGAYEGTPVKLPDGRIISRPLYESMGAPAAKAQCAAMGMNLAEDQAYLLAAAQRRVATKGEPYNMGHGCVIAAQASR